MDCSCGFVFSKLLIEKLMVKTKETKFPHPAAVYLLMRRVNTHHICFFTKLSSDQLRIQPQLGGGHLFDEILCKSSNMII